MTLNMYMADGVLYCPNLNSLMHFTIRSRGPVTFNTKLHVTTVNNSFQPLAIFCHKELHLKCCIGLQGFIQALLLTSISSWRIEFYDFRIWGTVVSPPCGVQGTMPLEALAISSIPGFQIAFPCIIWWPNLFHF